MLRNRIIGFVGIGSSLSLCRGLTDEKDYYTLLPKKEQMRYEWKHVALKDKLFYSSILGSFGSLATFATGSLVWMGPGVVLTVYCCKTLYDAEKSKEIIRKN